jgi:hypothetical protein
MRRTTLMKLVGDFGKPSDLFCGVVGFSIEQGELNRRR